MVDDTLINVEGVSKKFCRDLKTSLWYGIKDLGNELRGRRHGGDGELRPNEFWSVKDVAFEVKRGECIGLIGGNGAGKSTLLKMLNGLIKPDQGQIKMRGRVGALIELNAGFNPILTGRENIYISGQVLGLSKRDIDAKFQEIVTFSELEEFLDMPVQNYSSGMRVRLGFAVAAQLEPDILLIDEVLAVGDTGFKVRCLNRIHELLERSAVIFVSHSMPFVSRICTRAVVLEKGRVLMASSDVGGCIDMYNQAFATPQPQVQGTGEVVLEWIKGGGIPQADSPSVEVGGTLWIRVALRVHSKAVSLGLSINIVNKDLREVAAICTPDFQTFSWENNAERIIVECEVPQLSLAAGTHTVTVTVADMATMTVLLRCENAWVFNSKVHRSTAADMFLPATFSTKVSDSLYRAQVFGLGC
jgi:lipopolysaccharide transport system ATP-binding protein